MLGLAAGLLAALAVDRATSFFLDGDLELVRAVRDIAIDDYVTEVDPTDLTDKAVSGMLQALDRHSAYYGPREIAALERETTGEFLGIGVVFHREDGRILFPYPGSPAAKAGLKVGDRIVRADGQAVTELASEELHDLLHREENGVHLEVEDLAGDHREVDLQPEVVLDPTVRHTRMLRPEAGVGYLAIRAFSHRTPEEFDAAVAQLRASGLKALVIDLRANPGGILDAAVAIANRFIAEGALVATRSRTETIVTAADRKEAQLAGTPLVVLLDAYTASASEVLAAALQDHAVAVLVGEPTYGKGTVQTLKRVGRDGAIVKLTTAHYCSPSLRRIEHDDTDAEHSGIAPDLWVPLSKEEAVAVHAFLVKYTPPESALEELRAWEERENLHLIDQPPADRQLDAALALLTGGALDLHGGTLE